VATTSNRCFPINSLLLQAAYKNMGVGQIFHQLLVLNARPPVPPNMPDDYELLMER
jgi:hypothetical protein